MSGGTPSGPVAGLLLRRVGLVLGLALGLAAGVALVAYIYVYGPGPAEERERAAPDVMDEEAIRLPAAAEEVIRIGWTAWADAEVATQIAAQLLERELGLDVELVMADIGVQYQAVAAGDLDAMLMAWLPMTHAEYWGRVRDRVVNLGPIYSGRLGWVVPDFIPPEELSSIEDLRRPEIGRNIGSQIQGIDPGSGLMQASEQAMRAYELDRLELVAASGAAMTAVLDRAVRRGEWVVVTGWEPHWKFARYDLRFLDDPQGVLGGRERIHVLVRQGFEDDFPPEVTDFLARLHLTQEDLAELLLESQERPVEAVVADYLEAHPRRVRYWLTGVLEEE